MALEGTIKTPLGPINKKFAVIGGGAAAVIGFVAYRRYAAAQAASASTATTSDDTDDTTDDGSDDGEELAAEDAGYYGDDLDTDGSDVIGYDSEGNPVYGTSNVGDSTSAYSTNSDWTEAAVDALSQEGVDSTTATTAIANVLAGLTVTTAQENLFLQAVGLLGSNPPDGYPTPIKTSDTDSQPTGGGGTTTTGNTPAGKPATPGGLRIAKTTSTSVNYGWNAVPGATSYITYATYQGSKISQASSANKDRTISGLTPDHTYTLHVIAVNSSGQSPAAQITAKTPK
jgi:Fibronectin type III domain